MMERLTLQAMELWRERADDYPKTDNKTGGAIGQRLPKSRYKQLLSVQSGDVAFRIVGKTVTFSNSKRYSPHGEIEVSRGARHRVLIKGATVNTVTGKLAIRLEERAFYGEKHDPIADALLKLQPKFRLFDGDSDNRYDQEGNSTSRQDILGTGIMRARELKFWSKRDDYDKDFTTALLEITLPEITGYVDETLRGENVVFPEIE